MHQLDTIAIQKAVAPLRQQVLEALRRAIISGQLRPGERLTERSLTSMMSVSRTVVREVLRQLETEGLVAVIPNRGPVVRELSAQEAKDLYRIRGVLEGLAAQLFVENASDSDVLKLQRAFADVKAAYEKGRGEQILDSKNYFYDVLSTGARSETLAAMLTSLHARIWRWRALGLTHPRRSAGRSSESLRNLRLLIAAIKRRDAAAAEKISREETHRAAAEVMRLLSNGESEPEEGSFKR